MANDVTSLTVNIENADVFAEMASKEILLNAQPSEFYKRMATWAEE